MGNSTTQALNNKIIQMRQNINESLKINDDSKAHQMPSIYGGTAQRSEIQSSDNNYLNNKQDYRSNPLPLRENTGTKFKVSQRSSMFDFRKQAVQSSNSVMTNQYSQRQQKNNDQDQNPYQNQPKQNKPFFRPLTPIKENLQAKISDLPPPSLSVMDPDNNILFLDNGSRILNPVNIKTPPPPMWGEILEEENYDPDEEFYDHQKAEYEKKRRDFLKNKEERMLSQNGKKLKKKIVYVYESDSDNEESKSYIQKENRGNPLAKSLIQLNPSGKIDNHHEDYPVQSRRGFSNDGIIRNNQFSANLLNNNSYGFNNNSNRLSDSRQMANQKVTNQQQNFNLPIINLVVNNGNYQRAFTKPPLPSSQLKMLTSNMKQSSRQIRTGGFQKLPTIALLQKQH